jgi:nicotinamidase-related amidase
MRNFKEQSKIIISSQDWHPKNHSSFASFHNIPSFTSKNNQTKWPDHCVQNTW